MTAINIIVAGVGGQGTILASKILAEVGQLAGYDVKLSELHGMSQRGGSVITHVKFAEKVYSPMIANKEADYLIAFEMLEALRRKHLLKDDGKLIVNKQKIEPMTVITGKEEYPTDILNKIKENTKVTIIDALSIAKNLGNAKMLNTVLLGYLASKIDIACEKWYQAIKNQIKEKYVELNIEAFKVGYDIKNKR